MALPPRGVLQVRSADAEHVIAVFNPLLIAYFTRPPKSEELATLRTLVDVARNEALTGGVLFMIARKNMSGGIDPRVREFFERVVRENHERSGASAVVILMEGFGGSLMRSFITSLILLTNRRRTLQIFGSVPAACRWLAPLHGLDADALLRAYEEATRQIGRGGG